MITESSIAGELYRPMIFDADELVEQGGLRQLGMQLEIWRIHDEIGAQVRDLIRAREPAEPLSRACGPAAEETYWRQRIDDFLGGRALERYGQWVYYPWSGRLVHILPMAEFSTLRLNRNRHKVTADEQARLARLTIAVVGLSVGNAAAVTMALEGVGGHFKLADFDRLELSNMNRLRAGVHEVGLPKVVLAARQLSEINPYLKITILETGITGENVDTFLDRAAPVDVVVDECDSIDIKVLLRERARARQIPVVMETSDRGLIDVERFDIEPERPLFHGVLGEVGWRDFSVLSADQRLAAAARIVDPRELSTGLAASIFEIGESLTTWPQLASEVILGGASVTAAVRRLALGMPMSSGRRRVDLEAILAAPAPVAVAAPEAAEPAAPPARAPPPAADSRCSALARYLIEAAALAPSGGNAQPWCFAQKDSTLWMFFDRERPRSLLSVGGRALHLGLGAAAENICIAAAARGLVSEVQPFPAHPGGEAIAAFTFAPARPDQVEGASALAALHDSVAVRCTNRKPGTRKPLTGHQLERLHAAAAAHGVQLQLHSSAESLAAVAAIIGEADRIRLLCDALRRELRSELRWTRSEALATRDGIDIATLELGPAERLGLELALRDDVATFLRERGLGARLRRAGTELITSASAIGMLSVAADDRESWLRGGRAMQRVWLEATRMELGFQPIGTILYMLQLCGTDLGTMFTSAERNALDRLERELRAWFPGCHTGNIQGKNRVPVMMFRIAQAAYPMTRALRRPPDSLIQ